MKFWPTLFLDIHFASLNSTLLYDLQVIVVLCSLLCFIESISGQPWLVTWLRIVLNIWFSSIISECGDHRHASACKLYAVLGIKPRAVWPSNLQCAITSSSVMMHAGLVDSSFLLCWEIACLFMSLRNESSGVGSQSGIAWRCPSKGWELHLQFCVCSRQALYCTAHPRPPGLIWWTVKSSCAFFCLLIDGISCGLCITFGFLLFLSECLLWQLEAVYAWLGVQLNSQACA